jgi:hypothetical protein
LLMLLLLVQKEVSPEKLTRLWWLLLSQLPAFQCTC